MPNIPIDINWALYAGQIAYWIGYALVGIIIFGVMGFVYYLLTFNMKAKVWSLYGSTKDNIFSVGKPKNNRFKWIKNKSAWRKMWPLFNKQEIEPFDSEYIYPGKQVYTFDYNGVWIPAKINVSSAEGKLKAEINPVPHYVRNWQSLQHKKHAQEFAKHNFWEDNKYFIMSVITVAICCGAALFTVYLTYQFAQPAAESMGNLADSLNNFGTNIIAGNT